MSQRLALGLATGCAAAALLLAAAGAQQTRDRPPPGHTGGFDEPTCQACHFDRDVNAGPGSLVVEGLPDHYVAGETYTITAVLTDADLSAAGFQLAVRFAGDGRQAGSIAAGSADVERVEVTTQRGVMYAHHGPAGVTPVQPGSMRWTVRWTAPSDAGGTAEAVVVHAVANAADGDDSPLGDRIYAAAAKVQP